MKTVTVVCPNCGYAEDCEIGDGESLDGLACPNCDESMVEQESREDAPIDDFNCVMTVDDGAEE